MRVICPHCQKTVTIVDRLAEQAAQCPECKNVFDAPSLMHALPDEPRPTPEPPPPPPPPFTPAPPAAVASQPPTRNNASAAQTTPAGGVRFAIKQSVIRWLGPVGLVLLFLMSFFNWVGAYPAGYGVYTQSGWQMIGGWFSTDEARDEIFARESQLNAVSTGSVSIALVLIFLIPIVLIAALDLAEEHVTFTIPDIVQKVWPHRLTVLAIASLIFFGLLTARCIFGLGLETAVEDMAYKQVAVPKLDANAPPETPKDKTRQELRRAEEIARLGVRRTWGWRLAYGAAALAVIGYGLELMFQRRGRRPEPVVEIHW
jgi:hypothetical protein